MLLWSLKAPVHIDRQCNQLLERAASTFLNDFSFCVLRKKKVTQVLNDIRVCNDIILVGELFLESNFTKQFLLCGILGFNCLRE